MAQEADDREHLPTDKEVENKYVVHQELALYVVAVPEDLRSACLNSISVWQCQQGQPSAVTNRC